MKVQLKRKVFLTGFLFSVGLLGLSANKLFAMENDFFVERYSMQTGGNPQSLPNAAPPYATLFDGPVTSPSGDPTPWIRHYSASHTHQIDEANSKFTLPPESESSKQ